jgi:YgiT-type zinc finger domain-containing protein
MRPEPTNIRCSSCQEGKLVRRTIDHDVGDLVGMTRVTVTGLPALVCPKCGAVSMDGPVVEEIIFQLAATILARPELDAIEVRFLRKLVGDTQQELADRLNVNRVTVNRWENASEPITGPDAYAVRSHVFFRLRGHHAAIEKVAPAFTDKNPRPRSKTGGYRLDASTFLPTG